MSETCALPQKKRTFIATTIHLRWLYIYEFSKYHI